jgi:uncharacterized membrane-anchored protein
MSSRHWPFLVAVAVQALIVAGVPARRAYTLATGRTVFLKTRPVDPYDILSGYYVTLSYDVSDSGRLPGKPAFKEGEAVYLVLTEGEDGFWHAQSASARWPEAVPAGAVVLRGESKGWGSIAYGIESYFIPEGMGEEIEDGLRRARDRTRVEVKVDASGRAALVRLHVGSKTYDY